MKETKFHDSNWMVYRVFRRDVVEMDVQPTLPNTRLALTAGNVLRALFVGYSGSYRVLPDESRHVEHDYTHLSQDGSYGWNVPPWVEKNRGKVVYRWEDFPRYGKVKRLQ